MKDIKDNFIPKEEAKQLHDLGFRDECLAHLIGFGDGTTVEHEYVIKEERIFINGEYPTSEDIGADLGLHQFGICRVPLWQEAFRFFRMKYGMEGVVVRNSKSILDYVAKQGEDVSNGIYRWYIVDQTFGNSSPTYEEAQLECLRTLIKLCCNDTKRES